METIELDTCRNELIRDILATDNIEVLRTMRRAYRHAMNRMMKRAEKLASCTYTMEELNARIDEAEAEEGGATSEEFFAQMEREMPWLCK
ncbi:MAG: hypothetical protein LUF01_07865 [Bacteroides sp.]|nr:hypothetical protein [Bacteroides sp.]